MTAFANSDELASPANQVRIWLKDLDDKNLTRADVTLVSEYERSRATRLRDQTQRRRYLASCAITRAILADAIGVHPTKLRIIPDKCGKPRLMLSSGENCHHIPNFDFNVSHSENVLCVAVGQNCAIGVDIEVVRYDMDPSDLARNVLDPEGHNILEKSSLKEGILGFYILWTKREAFAKMQGHGIQSNHVQALPNSSWHEKHLDLIVRDKRAVGTVATSSGSTYQNHFAINWEKG